MRRTIWASRRSLRRFPPQCHHSDPQRSCVNHEVMGRPFLLHRRSQSLPHLSRPSHKSEDHHGGQIETSTERRDEERTDPPPPDKPSFTKPQQPPSGSKPDKGVIQK